MVAIISYNPLSLATLALQMELQAFNFHYQFSAIALNATRCRITSVILASGTTEGLHQEREWLIPASLIPEKTHRLPTLTMGISAAVLADRMISQFVLLFGTLASFP